MDKHTAAILVFAVAGVLMAVLVVFVVRFSVKLTRERNGPRPKR